MTAEEDKEQQAKLRQIQSEENCKNLPEIINRRGKVEQSMWDCYFGASPMPDKEQLKTWALDLGIPQKLRYPKT